MAKTFSFYEVVTIKEGRPQISTIVGQKGVVLGMASCEDGRNVYAVQLLESNDGWDLEECELAATGAFMSRDDFYDGTTISVKVNSKTGEGKLVMKDGSENLSL